MEKKIMKCYLEKCGAACGECADIVPKAMLVVFTIKDLNYIDEEIGNIFVSVGHSFFEKGYSASELRSVISEKIDDLVSSGACEIGTKELLVANDDIFHLEMNRWNTQPWDSGDGIIYREQGVWHTTYRIYTDIIEVIETIKWNKNAIECSKNVINAIEALLEAYQPEKSWDEIKTDPSYKEYIDICRNLHYSVGLYQDTIKELSFDEILN
jgi:hypothetical protein